ncbi:MAG: hypothetical protein DRO11_00780 [Methanobacteriota archaeon]|nr:MAG: hypothetical protein DRO11_00780 [Euryarchaeota archaeon]
MPSKKPETSSIIQVSLKKKIIVNPKVLSLAYVPENLIAREDLLREVGKSIGWWVSKGVPNPAVMLFQGQTGTGKTALAKIILKELSKVQGVKTLYLNAREMGLNPGKCVNRIWKNLLESDKPPRGLVEGFKDFWRGTWETGLKYFIVIDEIDRMSSEKTFPEFISCWVRVSDYLPWDTKPGESTYMLVLITNRPQNIEAALAPYPEIQDAFMPERIWFPVYNKEELLKILLDRAQKGLAEGAYSESVLKEIAEEVVENVGGGARNAIGILRYAAKRAEQVDHLIIDSRDVKWAIQATGQDTVRNWLSEATQAQIDVVRAIIGFVKDNGGSPKIPQHHLYRYYTKNVPNARSYTWFKKVLESTLTNAGILAGASGRKNRKGQGIPRIYELLYDVNALEKGLTDTHGLSGFKTTYSITDFEQASPEGS